MSLEVIFSDSDHTFVQGNIPTQQEYDYQQFFLSFTIRSSDNLKYGMIKRGLVETIQLVLNRVLEHKSKEGLGLFLDRLDLEDMLPHNLFLVDDLKGTALEQRCFPGKETSEAKTPTMVLGYDKDGAFIARTPKNYSPDYRGPYACLVSVNFDMQYSLFKGRKMKVSIAVSGQRLMDPSVYRKQYMKSGPVIKQVFQLVGHDVKEPPFAGSNFLTYLHLQIIQGYRSQFMRLFESVLSTFPPHYSSIPINVFYKDNSK